MNGEVLDIIHIQRLAEQKAEQMLCKKYTLKTRILKIQARSQMQIAEHGQFIYPKNIANGIVISSYRGQYDPSNPAIQEQVLEHEGNIELKNLSSKAHTVELVQLTLIKEIHSTQTV